MGFRGLKVDGFGLWVLRSGLELHSPDAEKYKEEPPGSTFRVRLSSSKS